MGWVTDYHPTKGELDACVQCGLCLPVCPTFRLTGRETASPRGRLHAMSAVSEGVVEVDEAFAGIIDFCLGCRACEPVCPGMVPYGRALEGARAEIAAQIEGRAGRGRLTVGWALSSRAVMRFAGLALAWAQRLRLTRLVPAGYRRLTTGVRSLKGRPASTVGHAGGTGSEGSVGLLSGCVQDEWFRPVNHAAVTLLEMAGYRVVSPKTQSCCGALAAHDGKPEVARRLASVNEAAFEAYEMVVATAAGCSAHLAGYGHWGGETMAGKAVDVTVAIARAIEQGLLPKLDPVRGPIAVQDPCHLRHAQRVVDEPRAILEAAGHEVVEVDQVGMCCGAAGLYTLLQPEASASLGNQKAGQIRSTGVSRVASANPGCEMQLRTHLGPGFEVAHPIEWYLRAVEANETTGSLRAREDSR